MGACWVCAGRGAGQVSLRPDGQRDGRSVCRVCTRRLVDWLAALPAPRGPHLAAIWPLADREPAAEPEGASPRAALLESLAAALPALDDAGKLATAVSLLDLGLWRPAVDALAATSPDAASGAGERVLTSLLTRLLDVRAMSANASELLEQAIYPAQRSLSAPPR
jgi:hypothetical protein